MSEVTDMQRSLSLVAIWQAGDMVRQIHSRGGREGIGFYGGKRKKGEEPIDAALREVREEGVRVGNELLADTHLLRELLPTFEDDGWEIDAFQTTVHSGQRVTSNEGIAVIMSPLMAWENKILMPATRAVLKNTVMIPDGIIDN
jgi:8-oxo-dGTP pyrophosphatase MutT (NUDIX family)